jgi:hypothetical protein
MICSPAATSDGIVLATASERWLNQRGHLGLPDKLGSTRRVLEGIFLALGGDLTAQDAKRMTPLPGDFIHRETGTLIEVDESQHFTSFRLLTLDHYPQGAPLGFDLERYRELCQTWSSESDKYFRTKAAIGFGPGGRQRQRAYHDALRDLATPAMGRPPLIRVDAADRNGASAYQRSRDRLHDALG